MNKLTIQDIDVKGKRCLVRVDFNVPIKEGVITNENRITGALPTIEFLANKGAKVILCSHLGRPKGGVACYEDNKKKFSLKIVADRLSELIPNKVTFADDVIGEKAEAFVADCKEGEIVLLENLRFYEEETKNDKEFAKQLARFGDIYVSDAFGTVHRAHASTAGVVEYGFIKTAVAGFLIGKELDIMAKSLESPQRPFVAILGGAKVSDKIGVINNLMDKVDSLIIGGGMAYTFFKAKGFSIGDSICEDDKVELAKELLEKARNKNINFLLPIDNIIADAFDNNANTHEVCRAIPDGWMGMDIGTLSIEEFSKTIKDAKTIIWNGPMGVFEMPNFANGTKAIAKALAESSAITIIGGGDSAAAVTQLGYADKMTHISTGGGASLELMEGKALPGIECLNDK